MQLHVCLLLVVVTTTVQEDSRNSTEEHATPFLHSDRDFQSPSQAGFEYTTTQVPHGGSGTESGTTPPLIASGNSDSEALQLPEEVGNNGAETSVTHFPETMVLTRNTETNPGMLEGTRGSHTSGRFAFPTVTSSPGNGTLSATPAVSTGTVYHQKLDRTSPSVMRAFRKLTSNWSQTDFPQSSRITTRPLDATKEPPTIPGSTWTNRDKIVVSNGVHNSSGLEDNTGLPKLAFPTSAMTVYGRVINLDGTEDGLRTPGYNPQMEVLRLGGSEFGTRMPDHSPHVSTTLASGEVPDSSGFKDHMETSQYTLGFSEAGTGTPGQAPRSGTILSPGGVQNSSKDRLETSGHLHHVIAVTAYEGFLTIGNSQDGAETVGHSPHTSTQVGVLTIGISGDRTETPGHSNHMSTMSAPEIVPNSSGSKDNTGTFQYTPQVGVLNLGGSQDGTSTLGHSAHLKTVTVSGSVHGFADYQNTDDTHNTAPTPTTVKKLLFVSPSILNVAARGRTPAAPPLIIQKMPKTEENGSTASTKQPSSDSLSASTSLNSVTTGIPKVYVVSDEPATVRVESIELLLQIILSESRSASGPLLEEDTSAWVEPYLQRAPGFSRMLGVWGSGRAVQMLLEFQSKGALLWLSASDASTFLHRTGLDRAARQGRSFRGSRVVNITLGGVQADICDWLLGCPAGFRCISQPTHNYSCSSVCHFDLCRHHGICTHHPGELPVCRCLVGEDFWFMGSRCDVRMTRTRLVCTCVSILALVVALIGSLAFVAVRRYRAAIIQAKVDQTRSSYRRFNHFDELSSRFWLRSASAGSGDSMDNPAFTRSDELLHMRALDRPCCYHDDTLSLASASSACTGRATRLNTIYPDSSQYGWHGSELSLGDGGVLDSGKASDLSVCSWPVEPIHWTPFPLLRQLATAPHSAHPTRVSRPRSYCEGMELVDMNRSWTA
ncbi:uncharacterized protein si:ch211-14k19.8 [Corythoichthys intestinalis]|uniref:uncharacterized protein si:ch211-14k19.8 n=1 Tax=Corythoichthys intestinalis TaxID=161448 RepID=UPI0025A514C4|nr:uncharacterized protein si:ch211-14k19.8 [Corythoichthys intestinalis]